MSFHASPQFSSAPALTPTQSRLCAGGWVGLAVWLLAVVAGPTLLASWGVEVNLHGHAQTYAHGHPFVDARAWWGIPNTLDVVSNLPLLIAGLWGLMARRSANVSALPASTRLGLAVFFWGLVLTSAGSAVYHWVPESATLVLDRLGVAVTFAGALSLAMAERVGDQMARNTLVGVLLTGCLSATMPLTHGNVLPWVVVQFGGMALMAWAALRKPLPASLGVSLGALLAWYALAKALEMGDASVFHATGGLISGHSLKHLVAALAAWPVIRAMRQNPRAGGR